MNLRIKFLKGISFDDLIVLKIKIVEDYMYFKFWVFKYMCLEIVCCYKKGYNILFS